jgi:hypothetical protein
MSQTRNGSYREVLPTSLKESHVQEVYLAENVKKWPNIFFNMIEDNLRPLAHFVSANMRDVSYQIIKQLGSRFIGSGATFFVLSIANGWNKNRFAETSGLIEGRRL